MRLYGVSVRDARQHVYRNGAHVQRRHPHQHLIKYLEAAEEKELPSVLLKTLVQDAHEHGISSMAHFHRPLRGGEELVVTGGTNGSVTLWLITSWR